MSENSPSNKKKHWRIILLAVVGLIAVLFANGLYKVSAFVVQANQFYNKSTTTIPSVKNPCLTSETLRVEIGGEKFAFPRKIINSLSGDDVVNIADSRDIVASPSQACQLATDLAWHIDSILLHIHPKICALEEPRCGSKVSVNIRDLEAYKHGGGVNMFPKTRNELLQKCKPPVDPYHEWHAKYWDACDYVFEDEGLYVRITFTGGGGMYPPKQIEETKATIMQAIRQYHIK